MRVMKRWLRSDAAVQFGCWLIQLYARLVWITGRWTVEGAEIPLRFQNEGRSIIVVSSELPELMTLCDRLVVMSKHLIAGELRHKECSEEAILKLAYREGN